MPKIVNCPIINASFRCQKCEAIGADGKCPYMRLDDWSQETLEVMRKLIRERNEKSSGRMG